MYKCKVKLSYDEEEFWCNETDLLDFMLTLQLPKLHIIDARLEPKSLSFYEYVLLDIQFVTFLLSLLFNVGELGINEKLKKVLISSDLNTFNMIKNHILILISG